jgi:surfeit locus 1 family protein
MNGERMAGGKSAGDSAVSRRPPWALLVSAAVALAILAGLGLWQLQRRAEKAAFIERLRIEAAAAPKEGWPKAGEPARALERRRVTGEYVAGAQAYVRVTLAPLGLALYVISPLRLEDGRIILVNRGAVRAAVDGSPRMAAPPPQGRVTLTGFRREPERRWLFSPADEPARKIFAVRDPALIGQALGLPADTTALLELEREPSAGERAAHEPAADPAAPLATQAEELIARIPNDHLNYALTWFGLALTLVGVLGALLRRRPQP